MEIGATKRSEGLRGVISLQFDLEFQCVKFGKPAAASPPVTGNYDIGILGTSVLLPHPEE
jgi:hypothetical protein